MQDRVSGCGVKIGIIVFLWIREASAMQDQNVDSRQAEVPDPVAFFSSADVAGQGCVDCGSPTAEWASVSHGTYLCMNCAGQHRGLGVHLSFVRSTTMDMWSQQQLRRMQLGGRALVKSNSEPFPRKSNNSLQVLRRPKLVRQTCVVVDVSLVCALFRGCCTVFRSHNWRIVPLDLRMLDLRCVGSCENNKPINLLLRFLVRQGTSGKWLRRLVAASVGFFKSVFELLCPCGRLSFFFGQCGFVEQATASFYVGVPRVVAVRELLLYIEVIGSDSKIRQNRRRQSGFSQKMCEHHHVERGRLEGPGARLRSRVTCGGQQLVLGRLCGDDL